MKKGWLSTLLQRIVIWRTRREAVNKQVSLQLERRGRCAIVFNGNTMMFDVVDLMVFGGPEFVGEYPSFQNACIGADRRNERAAARLKDRVK